jgi:hypothetical protein
LLLFEDGNINDRLLNTVTNLLSSSLHSHLPASHVAVVDTNRPVILALDDLWNLFESENQLKAVRKLTHHICTSRIERVVFPVNVNRAHWAAFEVDVVGCQIRYSNLLGWPAPADHVEQIHCWMRQITPELFTLARLLDVPCQGNWWSCAIVTFNTMLRCITDIPKWLVWDKDIARLEWLLLVCVAGGQYTCADFHLPDNGTARTFGLAAPESQESDAQLTTSAFPPSSPRMLAVTDLSNTESKPDSDYELDPHKPIEDDEGDDASNASWSFGSESEDKDGHVGRHTHRFTSSAGLSSNDDVVVVSKPALAQTPAATTRAVDAGVPTGRTRQYQDLCAPAHVSSCGILLFFTRLT